MITCRLIEGMAIVALPLLTGCTGHNSAFQTQLPTVEEVVGEVQKALVGVPEQLDKLGFPPLSGVRLTLQTTATKTASGSIQLFVLAAGGTFEGSATHEINLTLVPPKKPKSEVRGEAVEEHVIANTLHDAIMESAREVKTTLDDPSATVHLSVDTLEAKISFAVKYSAKIGEKGMVVISPLSVDLGGSLAKSASQTHHGHLS